MVLLFRFNLEKQSVYKSIEWSLIRNEVYTKTPQPTNMANDSELTRTSWILNLCKDTFYTLKSSILALNKYLDDGKVMSGTHLVLENAENIADEWNSGKVFI